MFSMDIAFSTDRCLCSENIYRYSSDCCRTKHPIWKILTTQKPDWWRRSMWYDRTAAKNPFWNPPVTMNSFFQYQLTRRKQIWDIRTTQKTTIKTTDWRDFQQMLDNIRRQAAWTPYLYSNDFGRWTTTQAFHIGSYVEADGNVIGLIFSCGLIFFCAIGLCVIVKRRHQTAILKRQLQSQHQPPSRPRMLVRRYRVNFNMENITSNPELNWNVPRTGSNGQEPVTHSSTPPNTPVSLPEPLTQDSTPHNTPALLSESVTQDSTPHNTPALLSEQVTHDSTPHNTPALLSEPDRPCAPPPYTLGSHLEPVAPPLYTLTSQTEPALYVAPPPYTPASQSGPVTPVAPPPYTPTSPSVPPPPYSENI
ncbi:hypothetical protein ACJMK2_016090 [Sinanodonta woodiana]|uniref:Uncharacterized protein n=1 Tax=Sinanodonta woodiana TaxID=1069815 RepID=A0ABD3USI0_SINWO